MSLFLLKRFHIPPILSIMTTFASIWYKPFLCFLWHFWVYHFLHLNISCPHSLLPAAAQAISAPSSKEPTLAKQYSLPGSSSCRSQSFFSRRTQSKRSPLRKHIRPHTPRPSSQSPLPTVDTHRLRPPCLSLGSPLGGRGVTDPRTLKVLALHWNRTLFGLYCGSALRIIGQISVLFYNIVLWLWSPFHLRTETWEGGRQERGEEKGEKREREKGHFSDIRGKPIEDEIVLMHKCVLSVRLPASSVTSFTQMIRFMRQSFPVNWSPCNSTPFSPPPFNLSLSKFGNFVFQ